MQLGFMSAILPELSLEEVADVAAEIGYTCVEVMCWPSGQSDRRYSGIAHLDFELVESGGGQRVLDLFASRGLSISGLGYYPNPLDPNEEASRSSVAHLRRVIDAAATLGVTRVNTFVGRDWTKSVDDNWPRFLEVWRPIIAHAEQAGVRVGIENCPMLFTADEWPGGKNLANAPRQWRRMFADIPSDSFGLNYDPSHLVFQQMDYLKPLTQFTDKLFHLHAKDVRLHRDRLDEVGMLAHPNEFHSPKLPGLGEVDWGAFFATLGDIGYDGPVCVEVEDRSYEGSLENRKAALRQSHTYLRQFIQQDIR